VCSEKGQEISSSVVEIEFVEYEMARISYLSVINANLKNIRGLEYAVNLYLLVLVDNQITNIEPLENLEKLTFLSLANNRIKTLPSLYNFPSLEVLGVSNNLIEDISIIGESIEESRLVYFKAEGNPLNNSSTPKAIHRKELDFKTEDNNGNSIVYEVWILQE